MKKTVLLILSSMALASAWAQDAGDELLEEEAPIKRYTVEVLVFTYEEEVFTGSEVFLPDPPPEVEDPLLDDDGNPVIMEDDIPVFTDRDEPGFDQAREEDEELPPHWIIVPAENARITGAPVDVDVNPFQLVLLTEDEYMLGDALRQFELLDAYETLIHVGWTQPAFPEEETPAIELGLFGELPEGLDGTLTLYLSRYLHLVVDLVLDAPVDDEAIDYEAPDSFFSFGDSRFGYDDEPERQAVRWRIQEDRIFKNGDLRYFDHPKFGVLAKVVRVENENPEEPDQDELIGHFAQ